MADNLKIPLPKFLKLLISQNIPVPKAMALCGKIYKEYNTPARLVQLDDGKLLAVGLDNKDDRKLVLKALRESGHLPKDPRKKRIDPTSTEPPVSGPSSIAPLDSSPVPPSPRKGKKRKRNELDVNEFLPARPDDEIVDGNLDFHEILDEEALKLKSTVVNRAPIIMAWSTMVAENMGFRREEALSIASVYTEMNAKSKGVSLGIYKEGTQLSMEAMKGGTQSYVELMGRRPLYQTQNQQWRALANGEPVKPAVAYSYIHRALRQTMPHVMGALKLLADSYTREELNKVAWSLYADFRPSVDQWGKRSEVKCSMILGLRKQSNHSLHPYSNTPRETPGHVSDQDEPVTKKLKAELSGATEYSDTLQKDRINPGINKEL